MLTSGIKMLWEIENNDFRFSLYGEQKNNVFCNITPCIPIKFIYVSEEYAVTYMSDYKVWIDGCIY
jgi:hypothetical protein